VSRFTHHRQQQSSFKNIKLCEHNSTNQQAAQPTAQHQQRCCWLLLCCCCRWLQLAVLVALLVFWASEKTREVRVRCE
jgi:hypothetical protein